MSLVQIVKQAGTRNNERLQEWLWATYAADVAVWMRKGLVGLESLEIFERLERVTPILRMVGDNLRLSVSEIQPQHMVTPSVTAMLSGHIAYHDRRMIAQLIQSSSYPGSIKLAKEFLLTVEHQQIYHRTQLPPVFEEYVQDLSANGRGQKTVGVIWSRLGHFIRWSESIGVDFGAGVFLKIRPAHITRYMQVLRRLASIGEMSQHAAALAGELIVRAFQYFSIRYGVPNVAQGISPPKRPAEFPRWIPSEAQVQAFFEAITSCSPWVCRDVCLFGLMYAVGFRPIETANIKKSDVRVQLNEVRITQKGGDDTIVSIPDSLVVWLRALVESIPDDGPIFSKGGKAVTEYERNLIFRLYASIAGWPTIEGPAVFRHAFCTHLLLAGVDYLDINRLARHKDLRTTAHYLHLVNQQLRHSAQAASNLLLKGVDLDAYTAKQN